MFKNTLKFSVFLVMAIITVSCGNGQPTDPIRPASENATPEVIQETDKQEAVYTSPDYADPSQFVEREVIVGDGEWQLPGTLTLPKGTGPFSAVILVHGPGPNDRDHTFGPNKPFTDLAWGLASKGIAVLRYDKRSLVYNEILDESFEMFTPDIDTVDDAVAAFKLLETTPEINPESIFIGGYSLGAMLAPRIAEKTNTAGMILLAGPALPLEEVMFQQQVYLAELDGSISQREEASLAVANGRLEMVKDPNLSPSTPSNTLPYGIPASYWLDLRGYRPAEAANELAIPMLIVWGERDYEVSKKNFARWQRELGQRGDVTFKRYPALNHLLMAGDGPSQPAEYNEPGNVAQDLIEDIAEWLTVTGKRE